MVSAEDIIEKLHLEPHPEGGYFKETYRSLETIKAHCLPPIFEGERSYSTCIYFLLKSNNFSAFHKINQDEIWHFYKGSPVKLVLISEEGMLSEVYIGNEIDKGQLPQFVVPKHHWFAAQVTEAGSFALVGCTVSPGFDFKDFVLPTREELMDLFPQHKETIQNYTRV